MGDKQFKPESASACLVFMELACNDCALNSDYNCELQKQANLSGFSSDTEPPKEWRVNGNGKPFCRAYTSKLGLCNG